MTYVSLEPIQGPGASSLVEPLEVVGGERKTAVWAKLGLRAGLAVPVMAGTSAVGVLEFFSDEPFPVDAELLELLLSVGTQVGRVVERQRSEEARLRALIDNIPANVYLRDLSGRFILVNRKYEEFWNLRNDDVRGKTLAETKHVSDVEETPGENALIDLEVVSRASRWSARRRSSGTARARRRRHRLPGSRQLWPDRGGCRDRHRHHGAEANEAELAELLRRVEIARDAAMEAANTKKSPSRT